ncbi:MAG: aldo/keto reductase [Porphyromonadaceae bacterium]|nr:aldo/keto reductase [Porphyromonadaceae bacterium]
MNYTAAEDRYSNGMKYNRCGRSGIVLPAISLGLWHNFGDVDNMDEAEKMILYAFDHGITHIDIANNYGPPPGSAETNFGKIFKKQLQGYRDEMIISSKAGYLMWPGPYGDLGSRKYLHASIDQSLKRTGLDYFDVFYSHRYDPNTPLEETMQALVDIVKQGKALYTSISNYPADKAEEAYKYLAAHNTPCLLHQCKYSMLVRDVEPEVLEVGHRHGVGLIAFSSLAQGLLTNKYLHGIPENSRAAKSTGFLQRDQVTPEVIAKVSKLNAIAEQRGQTLAEMALVWVLKDPRVTSLIVGASSVSQLKDNLNALNNTAFSPEELREIGTILNA